MIEYSRSGIAPPCRGAPVFHSFPFPVPTPTIMRKTTVADFKADGVTLRVWYKYMRRKGASKEHSIHLYAVMSL